MQPFELHQPHPRTVPVLFDSPHSGRHYPPDFGSSAALSDLRRAEDAYVDQLLLDAVPLGVTLLLATCPRCYLDLNREADDIDLGMIEGSWPGAVSPTEKSKRGLGLIRRLVVPGVPVYDRRLSVEEVQRRIEAVHVPYHAALWDLRTQLLEHHDTLWHVNWHSMKSVGNAMTPDGAGAARPDFVLGDLHGRSADPAVTRFAVEILEGMGYSVAVNDPYAGGKIVREMGDPRGRVHSIQIEMNRALYLDEARVEKTQGFERLKVDLTTFSSTFADGVR
ncbi:MAG: N-formylglutamate amidohydrolase [Gemmatimonadetes bacterium]|nr:N-formylglutamate amidohydrolase [Gemmatimonadota bacterium]